MGLVGSWFGGVVGGLVLAFCVFVWFLAVVVCLERVVVVLNIVLLRGSRVFFYRFFFKS